jgi:hypothetical protein
MVKYMSNLIADFRDRLAGMKENNAQWDSQSIKEVDVEEIILNLENVEKEIDAAKITLQRKRAEGRKLVAKYAVQLDKIDCLAEGMHIEEKVKLSVYGISTRKSRSTQKNPDKVFITDIIDNVDGVGYIISFKKIKNADRYEIERGIASNPDDIILETPYPFYKTTTKVKVVDTHIEKGKRYFYRVRAINSAGSGEWSEPVSRIQ